MTRKYEQRRRAEQQEETRLRIVEAAVELHATLGPARTTLSAVAEKAGVQRNTLYRHFPDESALLQACSAQYSDDHPVPGVEGWADLADPLERTRRGLGELYAYWEANQQMLSHVLRDAETEPLVREVTQRRVAAPLGRIHHALLAAWSPAPSVDREVAAMVDLAVGFRTWQSLHDSGLTTAEAAELMARLVACARQP